MIWAVTGSGNSNSRNTKGRIRLNMIDKHTTLIAARNLNKRVDTAAGPLQILDDICLEIHAGEAVAVVGVSGSGKSTLLGLLAGLDEPSSGEIFLSDKRLNDLDEDGRARVRAELVGFVFQSFQLLPGLTALENVMLPLELKGEVNPGNRAEELLTRVGLQRRLQHYPRQLSGGEQQRVAIARAFANEPAILFADEPTGNLDSVTGERIIDLLFRLNQEKGTTLVLVTHDEQLAGRCDRLIRLEAGGVIAGHGEVAG
jgi:putative ABC transport system ATP-binding protein